MEQAADDRHPVPPEEHDESERSPDVERHDEGEPEGLGLALGRDEVVPAEQSREHDGVTEARDREELGDALQHSEHDRLEEGDLALGGDRRGAGSCDQIRCARSGGAVVMSTGGSLSALAANMT